jgi:hypothetical protein
LERFRYIAEMAKKRLRSYAWAYHTDVADTERPKLSEAAYEGLRYAMALADAAAARANDALYRMAGERLTIEELAQLDGRSASTIRRNIALARKELFGEISDSAIYKRRARKRKQVALRVCVESDCNEPLPRGCVPQRRYCYQHGTEKARVCRHRRIHSARSDRAS